MLDAAPQGPIKAFPAVFKQETALLDGDEGFFFAINFYLFVVFCVTEPLELCSLIGLQTIQYRRQ